MALPSKLSKKVVSKLTRRLSAGDVVQEVIRKRLVDFDSDSTVLIGCDPQQRELMSLLTRIVSVGESNSLLIVGPRGCGKTLLMTSVLNELHSSPDWRESIVEVSLNGLLQTDDRIAIKEITRQMQLENVVGERVFGSFAENLTFLIEALNSGDEQTKAVLFILDEFDLFCNHHNQTLLYNLFDMSQSAKMPIGVIGITCRLDVLELLEKRVKSRFSHRRLYMFSDFDFDGYVRLVQAILTLEIDSRIHDENYVVAWNENIKNLICDTATLEIFRRVYNYSKDVRTLKSFLFIAVCKFCTNSDNTFPSVCDMERAYEQHIAQNAKYLILNGMTTLEICLVLAMKRLTDTYDGEPFNFEMVHREYLKLASRRSSLLFDKTVVAKSFEHLVDLELAWPASTSAVATSGGNGSCGGGTQKHYRLVNLMLHPSHIDELLKTKGLPTEVKQWASSLVT